MKNNLTEMVFILDRSGSMSGLEKDTVGGFNSMIQNQKKAEGEALVSTVLFNHTSVVIHDRTPLELIRPMTSEDYVPAGSTALIDAVGSAIHHIALIHKYARPEDVPDRTIFVITTDGMENASQYYTLRKVREMITLEKEKYGWEFLFLGANIDAAETAEDLGIGRERSANYHSDHIGTKVNYAAVSDAVCQFRASKSISPDWSRKIDRDYSARKQTKR